MPPHHLVACCNTFSYHHSQGQDEAAGCQATTFVLPDLCHGCRRRIRCYRAARTPGRW